MATKTATANSQTLLVTDPSFTTYSSGGFSGVIVDFSDPSISSLTLTLADPTLGNGAASVDIGATTVGLTLVGITAVRGSTDDDLIGYTNAAPRSGTAYTVYVSEGSDTYNLYGNSTLSYAGYAAGLTVNLATGLVAGKAASNSDSIVVVPDKLVMTSQDDTVLLDPTKIVGLVDGGANGSGGDTLKWTNFGVDGVTIDLGNAVDDAGNGFINFENFQGSSNDDLVSTGSATGYTLLASEGGDTYVVNGNGRLTYAGYAITASPTVGLTFNMVNGNISGKTTGTDVVAGALAGLVATDHNDTFVVSTLANHVLGSLDGGAGTDLLSFNSLSGSTTNLDARTASGISGTYTSIEQFKGSSGFDRFTAVTATGFTIFASGGSDIYDLNGHGTLSYAGFNSALTINLSIGVVIGKPGFGSDAINGTAPATIIGGDGNDTFTAKSTGNATLDGGLGNDVLYVSDSAANYFFSNNNDGSGILSKIGQTINFSHFETVVFTDPVTHVSTTNVLTAAPQDDLFGLGRSATFWRAADGDVWIWNNHGLTVDAYTHSVGQVDPIWSVVGIGDVAGDGKADVVFQNTTNGEIYLWNMNGGTIASQGDVISAGLPVFLDPTVWRGLGVRDFDGDGHADILWGGIGTNAGAVYEWSMNGGAIISQGAVAAAPTGSYSVLGFGEVNGDGKTDVVWYDAAAGAVEFWYMNGASRTVKDISFSPSLHIDGVGDFTGDGIADLLGHNAAGDFAILTMGKNASGVGTGSVVSLDVITRIDPTVWSVKQVNDYNGDGKADILFTSTAGDVYVWEMNGASIIGQGSIGHIDVAATWTLYS